MNDPGGLVPLDSINEKGLAMKNRNATKFGIGFSCLGLMIVPGFCQEEVFNTVAQSTEVNSSKVFQAGNINEIDISQNSLGNSAEVQIEGDANGLVDGQVLQEGTNNGAHVSIQGDNNEFSLQQASDGAGNLIGLQQQGDFNTAVITQSAEGLATGDANIALVSQTGLSNSVSVDQIATVASQISYSNSATIIQNGDGNSAVSTQIGGSNISVQTQNGNDNTSEIFQQGEHNYAVHVQHGNGLSLPSSEFGSLRIEQFGDASIIVEQYAPGY